MGQRRPDPSAVKIEKLSIRHLARGHHKFAVCPARGVGAALALPFADTEAMQLHLEEITRHVAEGAHAVLLLDRARWHTTAKLDMPHNITLIFLPARQN